MTVTRNHTKKCISFLQQRYITERLEQLGDPTTPMEAGMQLGSCPEGPPSTTKCRRRASTALTLPLRASTHSSEFSAFVLCDGLISWASRRHKTVAQSSVEAEYMAMAER